MVVAQSEENGAEIGKGCAMVLWVESIEECLSKLRAKDVVVLKEPYKVPAGLFASIRDSEGNAIKLYEGPHG